jgi:hypothetical protein
MKCKTSKINPTTKNSYQTRHIRPPSQILETLAGHVRLPGQTCLTSQPYLGLTKYICLLDQIPEAFTRHVRLPAWTCPTQPNSTATKGVFVWAFHHFFGLAFGRSKSWRAPKMRSWEAHGKVLLAFVAIQFLDLPKANKENDEKLETNTP